MALAEVSLAEIAIAKAAMTHVGKVSSLVLPTSIGVPANMCTVGFSWYVAMGCVGNSAPNMTSTIILKAL